MDITQSDALIVVDVQNDFCPGGALGVDEGDVIVPTINAMSPKFVHRVFTRDWHPADHVSFSETPEYVDMSWPAHCVANSKGAALNEHLDVTDDALVIDKGTDAATEAYSGFQDTGLAETLRERGVARLVVCGLATDYCVKATALDGIKEGFDVYVVEDAVRAVNVPPGSGAEALEAMRTAGVVVTTSREVAG